MDFGIIEKIIGYEFVDKDLLREALTHPSASHKFSGKNYQRLEFLGDAVLGLVIAEILMKKHRQEKEGGLSKRQAYLVSGEVLGEIAMQIKLVDFMDFSSGEISGGGKANIRNLENALEGLIGAIYLDSGLKDVQEFVGKFWEGFLEKDKTPPQNPVSALQEIIQSYSKELPKYDFERISGNDHNPIFSARVTFVDKNSQKQSFCSKGNSKKQAQKAVSELALDSF